LMFRPMKQYMKQSEVRAEDLEATKVQLEERVGERTQELAQATHNAQESLRRLEGTHRHSTLLSELIELLQASRTASEAEQMLQQFGQRLFPELDGAIYVYRSSRNLLEQAASWGKEAEILDAFGATMYPDDCWALRRGRQHCSEKHEASPRCRHLTRVPDTSATLCVPMMAQGEMTGVLVLHKTGAAGQASNAIPEHVRRLILTAVEQIALALANLHLREKLRDQAIRDPLTAMFNRRYFEETAERELRRAEQRGVHAGVIMIDIDHFKRLNDTRGHDAGDATLRRISLLLQNKLRVEDIACRYGGEEFVMLLPDVSLDLLVSRANQVREAVRDLDVRFRGDVLGPVTLSCGVAIFPEHGRNCTDLLEAADRALYQAKQAGRDQVVVAA